MEEPSITGNFSILNVNTIHKLRDHYRKLFKGWMNLWAHKISSNTSLTVFLHWIHVEEQILRCDITSFRHLTAPNDDCASIISQCKSIVLPHMLQNLQLSLVPICVLYPNLLSVKKKRFIDFDSRETVFCQDIKENMVRH